MKNLFTLILACSLCLACTNINAQNFEWAKAMGGTDIDGGFALAVDAAGNVYTTGWYIGTVDFDPGEDYFNLSGTGGQDIFVQKLDADGNFLWAKAMTGTGDEEGRGLAVDAAGNVYTTGSFSGTVDFDPSVEVFSLASAGSSDVFVQKMDTDGNFLWAKAITGANSARGWTLAVDAAGNVYTGGDFSSTADFDPGTGVFNLSSSGDADAFVQKMDADGNFLWAKAMGGTGFDIVQELAVDAAGNVYATGSFSGTVDFDPGTEVLSLTSAGGSDIFVQKMDTEGNFLWAKAMGGTDNEAGRGLAVDATEKVYVSGNFIGTVDFDPGVGDFNLTSTGGYDVFVQKLDADGNFLWAKATGGTGFDFCPELAVDVWGSVYTTGDFEGSVDFDPSAQTFMITSLGNQDIFVQKLDAEGNFEWAISIGGNSFDRSSAIAVDGSGNVYTSGRFAGTADFDPGVDNFDLTSVGGSIDIFVQKMEDPAFVNSSVNTFENPIRVFPNPTDGNLTIDMGKDYNEVSTAIVNVTGTVIKEAIFYQDQLLNLTFEAPTGIYFLHIYSADKKATIQLIKR